MDFSKSLGQSFLKINDSEGNYQSISGLNKALIAEKIEKIKNNSINFLKVSGCLFSNLITLKQLASN